MWPIQPIFGKMDNDLIDCHKLLSGILLCPATKFPPSFRPWNASAGKYEQEAVDAAIAHREEITPHLIVSLEKVAADPSVYLEDEGYYLVYLRGHAPRPFSGNSGASGYCGGLWPPRRHPLINFSATLPRQICLLILFNTCGGQFDLIKSLILNRRAEGFVPAARRHRPWHMGWRPASSPGTRC